MRRELEVGLAGVKCRKCVLIANVLALDQSYSVRIVCRAQRAGRGLGQSEVPKVRYDPDVLALAQSYSVRIVCRAPRAGSGLGQREVPIVRSDHSPVGHIVRREPRN